jgi:hypothetical protein
MPYVQQTLTGKYAQAQASKSSPWDPCMAEIAHKVSTLELVATKFTDPGPDWTEWRAYADDGTLLKTRRVDGY